MNKAVLAACLFSPSIVLACADNEYEQCISACLIPRPLGGCAQEYKDCKCLPKIGGDVGRVGEQAKQGVNNVKREVEHFGQDTLTTIQKAGGDTVRTLQRAGGDTIVTLQKAGGDTVTTIAKAGQDATATYVKGWKDTAEQTRRSFQDAVDAGNAVMHYTANQLNSTRESFDNAERRLREGKLVDSMWGLAVEPLQATEANFAKATQESSLIATAASSAAAVYGGPGGAAAYAAWSTYRATGNADQALRAGLLAAATAQAGTTVSAMPSGSAGEVLKKAAMAGAAGGIAVAAAGGDEEAIKAGFLRSSGAVLIQASSDRAKSFSPKARDAWDTVQCISARDVDCLSKTTWARDAKGKILTDANGRPRFDAKKLDPQAYTGKWTQVDPNSALGKATAIITNVSQLPKTQAIPLMKNKWVLTWTAGKATTIGYGQPTAVLTYVGPTQPFVSKVTYKSTDALPIWNEVGAGKKLVNHYACTLAGLNREVRVTRQGTGCEAIYRREDGRQDLLWHSGRDSEICSMKASEFVASARSKGIQCKEG